MPAEERDQLYRERFDQIDVNHDGRLDAEERAAWRETQWQFYRQQAAERSGAVNQRQH
ncbi:MAG TPA: EF-hand domain-containing protein [Stellaceae bacterium]|nr:EF-hand domain-containing protein [Stellaceae bacterium]